MELKREKPPNPNGNPNFKKLWGNLGEAKAVRLPESLHSLFRSLSSAINTGKIKVTDLENQCIDWTNVERELAAVTGKPSLAIVPDPIPVIEGTLSERENTETFAEVKARADEYQQKYGGLIEENTFLCEQLKKRDNYEDVQQALDKGLKLVEQFEELQKQSWGKSSKQTGEFKTSSRGWDKYREFKAWLANQ